MRRVVQAAARQRRSLSAMSRRRPRALPAALSGPAALPARRTLASSAVGVVVRRVLLYPVAALAGIGAAAEGIKDRFPDIGMPGIVDDLGEGVRALTGVALAEMEYLRARMTPDLKDESGRMPPRGPLGGGVAEAAAAAAAAAAGGSSGDGEDAKVTKLEAELEAFKKAHDQLVQEQQEHIDQLEAQLAGAEDQARRELETERTRMQEEITKLRQENEELHRVHIINQAKSQQVQGPKRAIDLFSDILSLRAKVDKSFAAQERLPRVVVVGDQSAGKTSVLEVLVRARIFPRGAGEMMTRAPIQVTLSEGLQHTCRIKGDTREYDLRQEGDLKDLRDAIEKRMVASVKEGAVISDETLALDLRGPGLNPMVLVDLPGIIQHHTRGMPETTKGSILQMCERHINNPNAIILCVQDASRDAEGSSVADIVRKADPEGDRTVFVLTKVDLAEKLHLPAAKLQAILKGEKFNMQARAYFAVITGTSNPEESIDRIRSAERQYFHTSPLVKSGVLPPRRTGTDNLARAVADVFWERVRDTVAGEARDIARALKQKENEWKNTYPNHARMSRDDLYNMGRHEILQNITEFNDAMTAEQWESVLNRRIWDCIRSQVIDDVYVASADAASPAEFKTRVENMLDNWVATELPRLSVQAARDTLMGEFLRVLTIRDPDGVYDALKQEVKTECAEQFQWDLQSIAKIRSVQELMLRDDMIRTRRDWDTAVAFMQSRLESEFMTSDRQLQEMQGPRGWWSWVAWQRPTAAQRANRAIINELSTYFKANESMRSGLNTEEIRAIQHSLKRKHRVTMEPEAITDTYSLLFKREFLDRALKSAAYCKSKFGYDAAKCRPCNSLQCADVLLFWRLHNMLDATVNMLRLEAMDYKRELQEDIRDVLNRISIDEEAKIRLISGKRVVLAEEIEVLRHLQSKLEQFTKQLKKEGKLR